MTTPRLDATHDPALESWVGSANEPTTDFPIQNLALCTFMAEHNGHRHAHPGVAIGDSVLDVGMLFEAGYFKAEYPELEPLARFPGWTGLARQPALRGPTRKALQKFLRADVSGGQSLKRLREKAVRPLADTRLMGPMPIFNYTDFYASIHHATTVGAMFRPDNPLLPNYKWVPIGYHGRASSIMVSGTTFRRPVGQTKADDAAAPVFGPCKMLDYELEVGCYVGPGNSLGQPISIAQARDNMLGLTLVNDWSARDIQKWEYQPLGPFLAKNFATTISPFVITLDALEPFRCPAYARPEGDPKPLDYLYDEADQALGGFDLTLEAYIQTADMSKRGLTPHRISHGRTFKDMYWTFAQMLTHHTSGGCNLQPGDLIASGTVSGVEQDSRGCLLERTWAGPGKPRTPIELPSGETRTFLADGDTVILKAYAQRDGFRRIGFGECRGTIAAE